MADEKPEEKRNYSETPVGGWPGFVSGMVRVINGMTNERLMLVSLICVLGFVVYYGQRGQAEQTANAARLYEESRESDRKHCADREERSERTRHDEAREMRVWYAGQAELQRRHDADREDKLRTVVASLVDSFDKYRQVVAALTQSVADLINVVKKN